MELLLFFLKDNRRTITFILCFFFTLFLFDFTYAQSVVYVKVKQSTQLDIHMNDLILADDGYGEPGQEMEVSGGLEPYSFEWWQGDVLISTEEDPMFEINGDTEFELIVRDSYGCKASKTITLRVTGIEAPELPGFRVFPVPASNRISIQFPENIPETRVRISDINGQLIWVRKVHSNPVTFPIDFPDGIYLLEIVQGSSKFTRKIIVSRQ